MMNGSHSGRFNHLNIFQFIPISSAISFPRTKSFSQPQTPFYSLSLHLFEKKHCAYIFLHLSLPLQWDSQSLPLFFQIIFVSHFLTLHGLLYFFCHVSYLSMFVHKLSKMESFFLTHPLLCTKTSACGNRTPFAKKMVSFCVHFFLAPFLSLPPPPTLSVKWLGIVSLSPSFHHLKKGL